MKYLPFFKQSPISLPIEDYKILSLFLIELIVTIWAISLPRYRPDNKTLSLHLLKLVPVIIFSVLLLKYIPFALSGMKGEQLMYVDNLAPWISISVLLILMCWLQIDVYESKHAKRLHVTKIFLLCKYVVYFFISLCLTVFWLLIEYSLMWLLNLPPLNPSIPLFACFFFIILIFAFSVNYITYYTVNLNKYMVIGIRALSKCLNYLWPTIAILYCIFASIHFSQLIFHMMNDDLTAQTHSSAISWKSRELYLMSAVTIVFLYITIFDFSKKLHRITFRLAIISLSYAFGLLIINYWIKWPDLILTYRFMVKTAGVVMLGGLLITAIYLTVLLSHKRNSTCFKTANLTMNEHNYASLKKLKALHYNLTFLFALILFILLSPITSIKNQLIQYHLVQLTHLMTTNPKHNIDYLYYHTGGAGREYLERALYCPDTLIKLGI